MKKGEIRKCLNQKSGRSSARGAEIAGYSIKTCRDRIVRIKSICVINIKRSGVKPYIFSQMIITKSTGRIVVP